MNPLDIEATQTDLPIDVNPPTTEEIRMAIRQIKDGKAAGPDNIPAEALKSDIEVTTNMLYLLFKKTWEEEQVPMDWKEGHLVKMPKKGDLSKCENYRRITLLSVPSKVFSRVLLNWMKDAVDAQLRDQQAGSRKDGRAQTKLQHYGSSSINQLSGTRHYTPTSLIMKRHLTVREGEDWQSKDSIPTVEEHMKLKTTFNQYQSENLQYEWQGSPTVWS
ncbi:unnamed protein product [Schistosoma mattheei]|uniref:Uncharacterized protein n=1 Tax=Schistosoma mattheei TaxID=31246 RepID=A0A183P5Z7_9TREM|nr:unnamed protein product [Schistosoma mattheei]